MNWIAYLSNKKNNKEKKWSLSKEMIEVAKNIVPDYFKYIEGLGNWEFTLDEMIEWIKRTSDNVAPFKSKELRKDVRKDNPGKKILDVQDLCYHLSRPESYYIEDEETENKIEPLERIGKGRYRLKINWNELLDVSVKDIKP